MDDIASSIPVFHYKTTNFIYTIKQGDSDSNLDAIFKEKWKHVEEIGILNYKLNIKEWKILEGSCRFVAQLHDARSFVRRLPEEISNMNQSLFAERFNFTKIPANEIILDIGDGTGNDVIIVNVSPVVWGHFLFVPERFKHLPQIMTESSLQKALELVLLSSSPYFRVIFNSLCGGASVNHLHLHAYYLKHQMLLEYIKLHELKGPVFELRNFAVKAFCLKLSWFHDRKIQRFVSWAFLLINHLQENNVAHNVIITRSRSDSNVEIYDDIRIFIWARKLRIGRKDKQTFIRGARELFGHLSVSHDIYSDLSEEKVLQSMADQTEEPFTSIQESMKQAIEDKMNEEQYK